MARIIVERGIDLVEGLTYAIPQEMPDLEVGERVEVPLGRGDRAATGYVVGIDVEPDVSSDRIKPILRRSAQAAGGWLKLSPALIELARWLSGYYCCPLGMVLATMVPAAVKRQTGSVKRRLVERSGAVPNENLPPLAKAAWEEVARLEPEVFPLPSKELARRLGLKNTGPLTRLVHLGLLREVVRTEVRSAWEAFPAAGADKAVRLSEDQAKAVEAVCSGLDRFWTSLLFGVTGSGKTEVYLRILERVRERGDGAIVLVPEISLTPQTAGRFVARFARDGVAVLHSGLTASQRHFEWQRVARGEAKIVVGARSAVFAPFPVRVGLIVVDEEHDGSYKQDQLPRYHARDVAIRRGQIEGCPVVLGSATPSLESWHNTSTGRYGLLRLSGRVGGGRLPRVDVVDLAEERRARASERMLTSIGPRLEQAIGRTLERNGQIILLLNRRGYASYICCSDAACGWFLTCDACDATLVYHKRTLPEVSGGVVRCHHCLGQRKLPAECPVCGKRISTLGFGTQRVEEELHRVFPALRAPDALLRLDSDTMQRAADYFVALEQFREGRARALLGTQMIAKGLDFPGVELIGVINADTALALPDFRASERTFQLVSQVIGRAGRGEESGAVARVLVQTINPQEEAIVRAAQHDYEGFALQELGMREAAGLPPIQRMARIVCRDPDAVRAQHRSDAIGSVLRAYVAEHASGEGVRVRGPSPCPIARIAGQYRFGIELLAPRAGVIQRALAHARSLGLVKSDAHTAIDVDPIALL